MTARLCGDCGLRAVYIVEPVGRYDRMGWADQPACEAHVGVTIREYVSDGMQRVQVRFCDTPQQPELVECCNEGCTILVGDGDSMCLNCEHEIFMIPRVSSAPGSPAGSAAVTPATRTGRVDQATGEDCPPTGSGLNVTERTQR